MWRARLAKWLAPLLLFLLRKGVTEFAPEFEKRVADYIYGGLRRYVSIKTAVVTVVFTIAASFLGIVQGFEETIGAIRREIQGDDLVGELAGALYAGLLLILLAFLICRWAIPKWRFILGLTLVAGSLGILYLVILTIVADETGFYGSHPRFWFNTLSPVVYTALSLLTTWTIAKPRTSTRRHQAATTLPIVAPTTPPPAATGQTAAQEIEGVA